MMLVTDCVPCRKMGWLPAIPVCGLGRRYRFRGRHIWTVVAATSNSMTSSWLGDSLPLPVSVNLGDSGGSRRRTVE